MKRDRRAYPWDMVQASRAVQGFLGAADLGRYEADLMLRSAVERQLQILGEALIQLAKLDPMLAARVPRHRQLIGFRNALVHGYAALNDAEVWRVSHENLPELHEALVSLLNELDPDAPR
ncbi:MAG TPA: DUF86 domain-containing protein [Rubrivivax sp.]|nr:DUF86 domain-containing protein [Rubrivivax sp.]